MLTMDHGNWCEGLTTYLADHRYEEQKGKGSEYRKQLLVNYAAYVNEKNETTLREFPEQVGPCFRVPSGYGKSAMVFHMLRTMTGDEQFFAALKQFIAEQQFRTASWDDIKDRLRETVRKGTVGVLHAMGRRERPSRGPRGKCLGSEKGGKFEITIDVVRKKTSAIPLGPAGDRFVPAGRRSTRKRWSWTQTKNAFRSWWTGSRES